MGREKSKPQKTENTQTFRAFITHLLVHCNSDGEILTELSALYERGDISDIFVYLKKWRADRVINALLEKDWEVDDILDLLVKKWKRQRAINALIPLLYDACREAEEQEESRKWALLRELIQCTTQKEREKALAQKKREYDRMFVSILSDY